MIIRLQASNRIENFITKTYSTIFAERFGSNLTQLTKIVFGGKLRKIEDYIDLAFSLQHSKFSIKRFCRVVIEFAWSSLRNK